MERERIGLIDVDGHNYPNLPLMKISAWHKQRGDTVEWYEPLLHGFPQKPLDRVYMSKVFSFSHDYEYHVNAEKIIRGGSGYAIQTINGKEVFDKKKDADLPGYIEHIYPDYSIYPEQTKDTAFGFLTRGCPRGCAFCHVEQKEGKRSYKVADLSEFWRGQKKIVLCDPNILACREHMELLQQLADSGAKVNFNQGLDVRLMNEENIAILKKIKLDKIHVAYDRYEDKDIIEPRMKKFKEMTGFDKDKGKVAVYILVNFGTTIEQDIERIQFCRSLNFSPYPMIYDREHADPIYKKLQRWCNNFIFWKTPTFEEYNGGGIVTTLFELNRLYNTDCMKAMQEIPDKFFELAICDPPYGINAHDMSMGSNMSRQGNGYPAISTADRLKKGRLNKGGGKLKNNALNTLDCDWDHERPAPEYFAELIRISQNQIIWGYNYFSDMLPPSRGVIVWDKVQPWENFSQVEIAYTSFDRPAALFRYSNTGGNNAERKIHPTQKPVALYAWIIGKYANKGDKIIDTHAGSGSCLVAAHQTGHDWLGFEIDHFYFEKADQRIRQERAQINIFDYMRQEANG